VRYSLSYAVDMSHSKGKASSDADRRTSNRYTSGDIKVSLRPRGHFQNVEAEVVDFNRYGIAIVTEQPLPMDRFVFITMQCGDIRAEKVVGVVHNSMRHDNGFRCGIRFRPQSKLQQDPEEVEGKLTAMELSVRYQPFSR
jgi:hypothetical protein